MKAYKIQTKGFDGFGIWLEESAGKAKSIAMCSLHDAYPDANYSWFTSCRRAPEFDYLADKGPGCVAWQSDIEHWQIDRVPSHWLYGSDVAPNNACTRTAGMSPAPATTAKSDNPGDENQPS